MTTSRIILFQVKQPNEKISRLAETASSHFERKERLVIFTDAIQYVDDLLWKIPLFLPHSIDTEDFIIITSSKTTFSAKVAFNLCPTPLLIEGFRLIYDFEDLTSPSRQQLSSVRFDAYKKAGLLIEAR